MEKLLLITNVVPLLLGTFAETCSLNLPQKVDIPVEKINLSGGLVPTLPD